MPTQPLTGVKFREFDSNGNPLAGGKLYTYVAGTTSPLATYTDASGLVANTNPIVLDAAGRADVWLQPGVLYKFVLQDASNVLQYTEDNFPSTQTSGSGTTNVSAAAFSPGGRLSLSSGIAVPTNDIFADGIICYVPYNSDQVPIYDGVNWSLQSIGSQLTQSTTDTTKSPAAVAANSNYDIFIWNDAGIMRLSRGPAWSSDTARGAGIGTTELIQINGHFVNKNGITNGPGATLGLYVGTVRSDGSSLMNDAASKRHVWNTYNRVVRSMRVLESTSSWAYQTNTWREARGQTTNQLDYVCGLAEDLIEAIVVVQAGTSDSGATAQVGIGIDNTSSPSGLYSKTSMLNTGSGAGIVSLSSFYSGLPGIGRHILTWLEWGNSPGSQTITWYGTANGQSGITGSLLA